MDFNLLSHISQIIQFQTILQDLKNNKILLIEKENELYKIVCNNLNKKDKKINNNLYHIVMTIENLKLKIYSNPVNYYITVNEQNDLEKNIIICQQIKDFSFLVTEHFKMHQENLNLKIEYDNILSTNKIIDFTEEKRNEIAKKSVDITMIQNTIDKLFEQIQNFIFTTSKNNVPVKPTAIHASISPSISKEYISRIQSFHSSILNKTIKKSQKK